MLEHVLSSSAEILTLYGKNPVIASELLNALHGAALKPFGVARLVPVSTTRLVLAMNAVRSEKARVIKGKFTKAGARTIEVSLKNLKPKLLDKMIGELAEQLSEFTPLGDGAYVWFIPDGFLASLTANEEKWAREGGGYFSHESLCVQNTGGLATRCTLYVYFEADGHEVLIHEFKVSARRSIHLRLDKIRGSNGQPFIPKSAPVGYKIVSREAPVIVQGSRILTSGRESEFASFGTTMAWAPV